MKRKATSALKAIIIIAILIVFLYPLFWMVTAFFKQPTEFVSKHAYALNDGFYWQNYVDAWTRGNMGTYFFNSLINTLISLALIIICSVTISFALTKMQWKLKKPMSSYFGFGIMVPVATTLIPLAQIFQKLGLYNTRIGLILVYTASAISFSVYLITGYLRALPDEIIEAGIVDGCSVYRLMWSIVIPLMKNAIITVLVIQFFFKWNDLIYSMTFVSKSSLKTMQTGLLYFENEFGSKNWGAIFASVSISVMPMLIMYLFLNKSVIEGMTTGAVKG